MEPSRKFLSNADKIEKPALREKLKEGKDMALLSKKLVTIKTDVPLGVDFHTLKEKNSDSAEIAKIFNELEFRSLIKKAQQMVSPTREEKSEAGAGNEETGDQEAGTSRN